MSETEKPAFNKTGLPDELPAGLLVSRDFVYQMRICDTARALGGKIQTVGTGSDVLQKLAVGHYRMLFLDLDTAAEALALVPEFLQKQSDLAIIAFGPHIEKDLLQRAKDAGCHEVMPRSKFTRQLASLIETHLLFTGGSPDAGPLPE